MVPTASKRPPVTDPFAALSQLKVSQPFDEASQCDKIQIVMLKRSGGKSKGESFPKQQDDGRHNYGCSMHRYRRSTPERKLGQPES
jgi:hypothetical protein